MNARNKDDEGRPDGGEGKGAPGGGEKREGEDLATHPGFPEAEKGAPGLERAAEMKDAGDQAGVESEEGEEGEGRAEAGEKAGEKERYRRGGDIESRPELSENQHPNQRPVRMVEPRPE